MVLEYFKEHQARENELFDKLFQLKTTQMGKVNVVSSEGYITQLVYDVLHHVHAKYASLEIHLELLNVNQIVRQVSDGIATSAWLTILLCMQTLKSWPKKPSP